MPPVIHTPDTQYDYSNKVNGRTAGVAQNFRGDVSWKVAYMEACTV